MLPRWLMLTTKNWVARHIVLAPVLLGLLFLAACQEPGPRALLQGEKLVNEGKYEEAVAKLKTATELLPANAQAWNHLGLALHRAGEFTPAVTAYQRALALDRNLAAARFNL